MGEDTTLDTLLDGLTSEGTEENKQPTDSAEPNNSDSSTEPSSSPANVSEPDLEAAKRNQAFGAMRQQIKSMTSILEKFAEASGIEYGNTAELMAKLEESSIAKLAEKQNVPVELLQKIQTLEAAQAASQAAVREQKAAEGFKTLMQQYGLTTEQLQNFAVELDTSGKNPFAMDVDVVKEYRATHFDELLKSEVEKAVQAALAKDSSAAQHSTAPGTQQGSTTGSGEKITTQAGLAALLKDFE